MVLLAVARDGHAILFASDALRADRACALAAVRQSGAALQSCAPALRDDDEVVSEAVACDGKALCWASGRLREDPRIVVRAATQCVDALKYCSAGDDIERWRQIMITCCSKNGLALRHAARRGEPWCDDRAIVEAACKEDGAALAYASPRLRSDRLCVELAVRPSPLALEHAGPTLANTNAVVRRAVEKAGEALAFAGVTARGSADIVLVATVCHPPALQFATPELRSDLWLVVRIIAASSSCTCMQWASKELAGGRRVRSAVKERLVLFSTFRSTFLRATIRRPPMTGTLAPLGGFGNAAARQMIAKFVGVPLGEELAVLRRAARNLFIGWRAVELAAARHSHSRTLRA